MNEPRDLVVDLIHKIGATLTDAALGRSRGYALDVQYRRQEMGDDEAMRAKVLDEVLSDITAHDGLAAARRWVIGGNPLLGEMTVITAVREGRFEAVRDAARAFIRAEPDV